LELVDCERASRLRPDRLSADIRLLASIA
jgi:hypothetical protein